MNTGRTVFSQIMDFLPLREFRKYVKRYHGNYKVQKFSCMDQFLCMAFAQLIYRKSLRDIEACLRAMQSKLYHMGIRVRVSKSTLADANETRDWRIYADFAQVLMDCNLGLCAGSNNQKATESGFESLHNSTDFERDLIRESVYFTITYGSWLQN